MRTYETIFIVHPEAVGDSYAGIVEKFKGVLANQGANLLKVDEWGTRKLAYPVKKQGRGTYVLMAYEAGPTVVAELERRLRIDETIIKYQTVLLKGGFEEAPAAAAAAPEAPAAATEETAGAEETA
jgi:small subunit ribosomal protein S6